MKQKYPHRIDLILYGVIMGIGILYTIYLRSRCEGLGCLGLILPLMGMIVISIIECIINIIYVSKGYVVGRLRKTVFIITSIITISTLGAFLWGLVN